MDFDQHAFISYAHIDNKPLSAEQQGWVTRFHDTLGVLLSQQLGEDARIWRDQKLDGSDVFDDEIETQLARTAILVSILTPRYVKSEWCRREVDRFCAAAASHGGMRLGKRWRFLKVVKTPVDLADPNVPEMARRSIGYDFFKEQDGHPEPLDPAFGKDAEQAFLRKLNLVAMSLADNLKALAAGGERPADPNKPLVFLAECGRDLREVRERVEADLRTQGYRVLPELELELDEDRLRPQLREMLQRCELAVHLVGRSAGPVPAGPSGQALVLVQNAVAAEVAREDGAAAAPGARPRGRLRRIIWLPAGTKGERPDEQAFIDALQTDPALRSGADLLTGDVESLKGAIRDTLRKLAAPPPPPAAPGGGALVVHLQCDEADRSAVAPLMKALRARGLVPTIPIFSGAASEMRAANQQLLLGCDRLLLFYGAGSELWKHHQLAALRKLAALNDRPALRETWIVLAAPNQGDKDLLVDSGEPRLLDLRAGIGDSALQPLWATLRQAGAAP